MDCKTARENINIFDSLSQKEKDNVLEHVQRCEKCNRELVNSELLLEELLGLDELEAPEGLAQSAIKKAKKRKLPIYSYVSVAAAAVIAIAVFSSSSFLKPKNNAVKDMSMGAAPKQEDSMRTSDDVYGILENGAMMDEAADCPESLMVEPDEGQKVTTQGEEVDGGGEVRSQMCYIYVSADKKEFVEKVNTLLTEKGIYFDNFMGADETQIYNFVVGEMHLSEFEQLLEEYEIDYDGAIMPGTVIEMTVEQ